LSAGNITLACADCGSPREYNARTAATLKTPYRCKSCAAVHRFRQPGEREKLRKPNLEGNKITTECHDCEAVLVLYVSSLAGRRRPYRCKSCAARNRELVKVARNRKRET
jgi:RNase P subunit RPR2